MGFAMCSRLLDAGYPLIVHNRTAEKARALLDRGAQWADSPGDAARRADITFTIVALPADVREVMLGEDGVLRHAAHGSIVIDMTTSEPSLAVELSEKAKQKGIYCLDAPVSGGDVGAKNGTLSIMVGGDREVLDRVTPILSHLGKTIRHQGAAGSGQHTKMVNQMLIGPLMIGVCEALLYAKRAGLDARRVIESVGSGAAGSWAINHLGPRILDGDLAPGFLVEHFIKDMNIALMEGAKLGLELPGLELARKLYGTLLEQGHGRQGTQALMLELERLAKRP
jgi:3-hydroxyisobutyrate dehydrogenase